MKESNSVENTIQNLEQQNLSEKDKLKVQKSIRKQMWEEKFKKAGPPKKLKLQKKERTELMEKQRFIKSIKSNKNTVENLTIFDDEQHSQITNSIITVAIEGCLHGKLNDLYNQISQQQENSNKNINFLLNAGDFQSFRDNNDLLNMSCPNKYKLLGDFVEFYDENKKTDLPTIFIGGNHEASNQLHEISFGGQITHNIQQIGRTGVINYKGLRIAGVSGIYNQYDQNKPYNISLPLLKDDIKSIQHYRKEDFDNLMKLTGNIDIFISHDWPSPIWEQGNQKQLFYNKKHFKESAEKHELGCSQLMDLLIKLKPRYWFSAHLHVKFEAIYNHKDGSVTKFFALSKINKQNEFLIVLDIENKYQVDNMIYHDIEYLFIKGLYQYNKLQNKKLPKLKFNQSSYIMPNQKLMNTFYHENKNISNFIKEHKGQLYLLNYLIKESEQEFLNFYYLKYFIQSQYMIKDQI